MQLNTDPPSSEQPNPVFGEMGSQSTVPLRYPSIDEMAVSPWLAQPPSIPGHHSVPLQSSPTYLGAYGPPTEGSAIPYVASPSQGQNHWQTHGPIDAMGGPGPFFLTGLVETAPPYELPAEPAIESTPSIDPFGAQVANPPYELPTPIEHRRWFDGRRWLRWRSRFGRKLGRDTGLGFERVMFAPMVLDTAVGTPNMGLRIRSDRGMTSPDRLEYIWAKNGKGPTPETRLDILDTVFRTEIGNAQAMLISEMTMRSVDPEVNANTVGFGDMVVGGKALVYDTKCTKVSTIFLTHLNTGLASRGMGTGHVSLEPGMLLRHQWSDLTFLHGQLKYRIPIAGTPNIAGDVLNTGWGISTLWRETDQFALMPTFEMQTNTFLFGGQTLPNGVVQKVDGKTAIDFFPGLRCAFARSSFGLWEMGVAGGVTCADRDWFDSRLVLDLRLVR